MSNNQYEQYIENGAWEHLPPAELQGFALYVSAKKEKKFNRQDDLSIYQDDPVGFGQKISGDTYTDDVCRMMESVRDYPITIAKSSNSTGKSYSAARVACWFYKAFPDSKVYVAAAPPEENLRDILWGQIVSVIFGHRDVFKGDSLTDLLLRPSQSAIDMTGDPLHLIRGLRIPTSGDPHIRQAKFSGKHAPHILFILDEGDAIPDEVYAGIETCMTAGFARLLIMFNPRHKAGAVYRMERDQRANVVQLRAFDHPNVVTGRSVIPGAVSAETVVRHINNYCRWIDPSVESFDPDSRDVFKLPAYLEDVVAKREDGSDFSPLRSGYYHVMESIFHHMVLAEYPPQAPQQLISEDWITAARSRWDVYVAQNGEAAPQMTRAKMGFDVADSGADSNVLCFRYGGFVERPIDGVHVFPGIDLAKTEDHAIKQYKRRNVEACYVDGTGVGAGVAPHLIRGGCLAAKIMVAERPTRASDLGQFAQLRDQLYWLMREWLQKDPSSMLPPDEKLIGELLIPTYDIFNGHIKITKKQAMKDLLKRSPDRMEALILTFADSVGGIPLNIRQSRQAQARKAIRKPQFDKSLILKV